MKLLDAMERRSAALRRLGRSARTIEWYEMWLRDLARSLLFDELEHVTLDDLRRWCDGLLARNLAPASRRGAVTTAKIFFRWCVAEGYLEVDPSVRLEKPTLPRRMPRALETGEVLALLNAAAASRHPERDQALVVFMVETGCRVGELIGLRPERVHLSEGVALVIGKGNQERFLFFGDATRKVLDGWLAVRPSSLPGLFGLTWSGVHQLLLRLRERAGVTARCNPHALRHTAATLRVENNAGSSDLQQIMGWSDIKMAEVYTGLARERLARRAAATSPMDKLLIG